MFTFAHPDQSPLRDAVSQACRRDEILCVSELLHIGQFSAAESEGTADLARHLIAGVRANRSKSSGVDALMHEFSLSSEEGVALMCLAEALLRIPDTATRDKLIADKLTGGDWKSHLGNSPSLFVNAAAWGLLITGKLVLPPGREHLAGALGRALGKGGQPLIRRGVNYAMKLLGKQFVTGQTIEEAIKNGKAREKAGYRFSFDMLGEAALTQADADRYYRDYTDAIHAIGRDAQGAGAYAGNGISVKLSAIHPRYARAQHDRVMRELLPRLKALFMLARQYDIGLNIDAEEAGRLDISLDLLEALVGDPDLQGFRGIGFVVQAYQKRCPFVIDFIVDLARRHGQRLMIRLVKGAYWDSEIKWAQVDGMEGYPVYTRKVHTDIAYIACARKLLAAPDAVFPQFATHNAYTLAAVYHMAGDADYEFQCLHGMGETLYDRVVGAENLNRRVRIYAPVGTHETLLAYLVRRLLENGANSSFVNRIVDEKISIDDLVRSPFDILAEDGIRAHRALPLPRDLYGAARINSRGWDLTHEPTLQALQEAMNRAAAQPWHAASLINGADRAVQAAHDIKNPANHQDIIGSVSFADNALAGEAVGKALTAQAAWAALPPHSRSDCLRRFADLLEEDAATFMMLAVREAGKTLANAVSEVREAVDFCRYYAHEAQTTCRTHRALGVIAAISPWNFPLAIFVGEVAAALAVGNSVVAKPAEQTPLIAFHAVRLLHRAGVPTEVLQLVLGAGDVGAALVGDPRIAGVIFTGSTDVARLINQTLAAREDTPVLIAETGGMNAMIVDSSALPEQVVGDVVTSAFDSAGQRCSALRILCLQEEIADTVLAMLKGAMDELRCGDPRHLSTDIGPVIDAQAQSHLQAHIARMKISAVSYHEAPGIPDGTNGTFIRPVLFELNNLDELQHEVFGPVLHVVRYRGEAPVDALNAKGYALTHGIHSRIDAHIATLSARIHAGNIYVNRNIVGAVVGVQPFGGHGLSGTGPKAGGPFYLQRLCRPAPWILPRLSRFLGDSDREAVHTLYALLPPLPDGSSVQAGTPTLRHAQMVLDGPTGERNVLHWQAPQRIWLYGGTLTRAANALLALAGAGIHAVTDAQSPLAAHAQALAAFVTVCERPWEEGISHVLMLSPLSVAHKQALAERDGAIIRLVDNTAHSDISPLFAETATSTNTSAAGGNTGLMAMADG